MEKNIEKELKKPFPMKDIFWKRGMYDADTNQARALPFIMARSVEDRLDTVLGHLNWMTKFTEVHSETKLVAARCSLSIRVNSEWITREDIATLSGEDSGLKMLYSEALKRAAVQFGVGRYLYDYPAPYMQLDAQKNFVEAPTLPLELLPEDERLEQEILQSGQSSATEKAKADAELKAATEKAKADAELKAATEKAKADDELKAATEKAKAEAELKAAKLAEESLRQQQVDEAHIANATAGMQDNESVTRPTNLSPEEDSLVNEMLEKIEGPKPLNSSLLLSYLKGPKAKQKLSENTLKFLLHRVNARPVSQKT